MNYAIILAGGVGSRFWPLSRPAQPKQFLHVCSGRPMLEESVRRIRGFIRKDSIYIATNKAHRRKAAACVKQLHIPNRNIFLEPEGKNTLAPIAVLSRRIAEADPEAVIIVLPSDHLVRQPKALVKILKQAVVVAQQGYLVTLGIVPDRPETGYGYLKVKQRCGNFYRVEKFIEKPDSKRAKKFLQDRRYYWNNGIFIFKARSMMEEIRKLQPAVFTAVMRMKTQKDFARLWAQLPSISLDYAIMEKTRRAALLRADYGWVDIGSWPALQEAMPKDSRGNILRGNCLDIESRNTLVWSDKRLVATVGLNNLIVIDTPDALLVCAKDKAQDVKRVVQKLKEKNCKERM
jgi:mannose-1-phosphate guanylyltransferase/mannose-6-phosphate isomerase